ncbi:MAG: SAM-dependent methyltransferase [Promethearchaeota archaeon]
MRSLGIHVTPSRRDWIRRQARDPYYRKARKGSGKAGKYRSRAAYKLLQIDAKFRIFKRILTGKPRHLNIVDLCCAPGSFLEVISELLREYGVPPSRVTVVGVDIAPVKPVKGVKLLRVDLYDENLTERIRGVLDGEVQLVTADCSPKLSGAKHWDQQNVLGLAERAFEVCRSLSGRGGCLVTKIFQGEGFREFVRRLGEAFSSVKTTKPPASRQESREMYCVGLGYMGGRQT